MIDTVLPFVDPDGSITAVMHMIAMTQGYLISETAKNPDEAMKIANQGDATGAKIWEFLQTQDVTHLVMVMGCVNVLQNLARQLNAAMEADLNGDQELGDIPDEHFHKA